MKKRPAVEETLLLKEFENLIFANKLPNTGYCWKNLSWSGDDVPEGLRVGDALFDPGDELRPAALQHLPDAGPKLVEEVDTRVAANRRAKSFERR